MTARSSKLRVSTTRSWTFTSDFKILSECLVNSPTLISMRNFVIRDRYDMSPVKVLATDKFSMDVNNRFDSVVAGKSIQATKSKPIRLFTPLSAFINLSGCCLSARVGDCTISEKGFVNFCKRVENASNAPIGIALITICDFEPSKS